MPVDRLTRYDADAVLQTDTASFRRATWLRTIGLAALVLLCLLAGGYFSYDAMQESLEQIVVQHLEAINDANAAALNYWIDSQKREVRSWARQEAIQDLATALAEVGRDSRDRSETLRNHHAAEEMNIFFGPVLDEEEFRAYALINREGLILAASDDGFTGSHLPAEAMVHVARIFQNGLYFSKPLLLSIFVDRTHRSNHKAHIILGSVFPNSHPTTDVALVFLLDPHLAYSRILGAGSFGFSGNTYAVDREGHMLSTSRFEDELRNFGLIEEEQTSILNVLVCDPGRKLESGRSLPASLREQPLTAIVKAAANRPSGVMFRGYRDYRGIPVYGSWRWFDEYDFGVITEMAVLEALAILRPAGLTVMALFLLLILAGLATILVFVFTSRIKHQLRKIRQLGQYELVEKLGEGGIGTVYCATHAMLQRPTALKLLRSNKITPDDLARFEREVQLTARLTHPNTIEIYDYGKTDEGIFYYAMEYLRGISLARLIEIEEQMPAARVAYLLRQVCGSLHEAHTMGLVHRDIKPLNIFICQRGLISDFIKVLDFGLVKEMVSQENTYDTLTDVLMGTPEYIAPERIREPASRDPRSDLYAVGAVAYNMLTGQETYMGSSREVLQHALASPVPYPSAIASRPIPPAMDELVRELLAKKPEERPPSAMAVMERLDAITFTEPWGPAEAKDWADRHSDLFEQV